ncbi:hypothetical protein [Streptomyces sp. NPDC041003]|uniref:hypothetical protein n=1 Tax=Streptomyces sp. NPDC041003 TaxID=3155730 RepID=UPI0033DD5566
MLREHADTELLAPGLEAEFAAMDGDDDGIATVGQFEVVLVAFGLEAEEARVARALLDADGDGLITRREYLNGWTEFLLGEAAGGLLGPVN